MSAHAPAAKTAGLSLDVVMAIRKRREPDFKRADEKLIYEAATELLESKELKSSTYERVLAQLGLDLTIELVTVVGFYGMISEVLTAFDVPTSAGERPLK
jgi:4-carboxymuconolactone decarboxylase